MKRLVDPVLRGSQQARLERRFALKESRRESETDLGGYGERRRGVSSDRITGVEPSIKGSVVQTTLDELRNRVQRGSLSEAELRKHLAEDAATFALEQPINIAQWYPARLYDSVLRAMVQDLYGGRIEELAQAGRATARVLADKGVYAQLESRRDGSADAHLIRLVISLSRAIYNFTSWELGAFEEDAFEIVISDAQDYPDTFMWRNVGFVEVATTQATGHPWTVTCSRPTRDRVVLRATRVPA